MTVWLDPEITAAAITVPEATLKEWLRVDATYASQDVAIALAWRAAVRVIGQRTRLLMAPSTVIFRGSSFGTGTTLVLPRGPITSIDASTYHDGTGAVAFSGYELRHVGGMGALALEAGGEWPEPEVAADAITIEATGGFATWDDVPENLQMAAAYLMAHWFRNREAAAVGTITSEMSLGLETMLGSDRKFTVA